MEELLERLDAEKQTGHNQRSDMRMDEILNKKRSDVF